MSFADTLPVPARWKTLHFDQPLRTLHLGHSGPLHNCSRYSDRVYIDLRGRGRASNDYLSKDFNHTRKAPTPDHLIHHNIREATKLLNTSANSWRNSAAGLIELAPVHLPSHPEGDNNHFGWPVAAMVGEVIIVVHRSMPGHNRELSGNPDQDTTYSTIVRSADGGRTWMKPYDVRDCMTEVDRNRGGSVPLCHRYKFDPNNDSPLGYKLHLNAIGTTHSGAVVLVSDHGVFRSEDKGETWRHLRLAFREDHHDGPFVYVGPRIIDDPKPSLLLFAHHNIYHNRKPHDIACELAVYSSHDGGKTWEDISVKLPDWCRQAEPNVITHDGVFLIMARNQTSRYLVQIRWEPGINIEAKDTNMLSQRSVDTSDVIYNPVTGRFEVVQSNRTEMSINLFSRLPRDWNKAEWKFEGQLFKRSGTFYSTADGFHTGGAVLDRMRHLTARLLLQRQPGWSCRRFPDDPHARHAAVGRIPEN